jgi:hypothetical protein
MTRHIIRKTIVAVFILLPLFTVSSCRKQAKCGCGKDRLFSITNELVSMQSIVYGDGGSTAYYQEGTSTYYFCNPGAMYETYQGFLEDNEAMIKLSGDVYWECNYLYSSSNSYQYQYYKVYNIEVTGMESELYGK